MIYDVADKAIKQMNRLNLKAFDRLKLAKWDELSVIKAVTSAYNESVNEAKKRYKEVGIDAYAVAMMEAGHPEPDARHRARRAIDDDWILDMLEETDPVTLYVFLTEADRKKHRLIEALAAAQDKSYEIDKALRLWTVQVAQQADDTVFNARMRAFRDAGIERVMWITQHDARVCKKCDELDGRIFRVEDVPPPQHWGCRCILRVVD